MMATKFGHTQFATHFDTPMWVGVMTLSTRRTHDETCICSGSRCIFEPFFSGSLPVSVSGADRHCGDPASCLPRTHSLCSSYRDYVTVIRDCWTAGRIFWIFLRAGSISNNPPIDNLTDRSLAIRKLFGYSLISDLRLIWTIIKINSILSR